MKTSYTRTTAALALASFSLIGCASFTNAPPQETDWQKVNLVDRYHQSRGNTVIWVNHPQRSVPVAAHEGAATAPKAPTATTTSR